MAATAHGCLRLNLIEAVSAEIGLPNLRTMIVHCDWVGKLSDPHEALAPRPSLEASNSTGPRLWERVVVLGNGEHGSPDKCAAGAVPQDWSGRGCTGVPIHPADTPNFTHDTRILSRATKT
jgi:hypothetical protein